MDVDEVAGELYALRPAEFTSARDAYAAEARSAGDRAAARGIAELRRPTLAAWASNLLVCDDRAEADRFLRLGQALREAHRALDAGQLRELSRRRQSVIAALARRAQELAARAGQPVGESVRHEVEQILHSVLADPDAAARWATGRLVKAPPVPVGFTDVGPETVPARPGGRPAPDTGDRPPAARSGRTSPRVGEKRRARLEAAREEAAEAAAEATRREDELRRAEESRETAAARLAGADEQVTALEKQLRRARAERDRARTEAGRTAARAREAATGARSARRAADAAARTVSRLTDTGT
ncbi:hypothetical protein ACIBCM_08015 [Streptomyces sp. NPDC051018]|uniref:hypothetical protein n=1 Tax=Streptomyces sp. NPDC051018 TaxID=3365639 RepID=UPI0037AB2C13